MTATYILAMDMAMILVIWLESHESSHEIVHFVKYFFQKIPLLRDYDFPLNLVPYKGNFQWDFHFSEIYLFMRLFSKQIQN